MLKKSLSSGVLVIGLVLSATACGSDKAATPATTAVPAAATTAKPAASTADIVDTAVAAGSFKTLAAALTAAGLVDTLKGPGPFTVFAPTDEAFAKLPNGTLDDLLKPENRTASSTSSTRCFSRHDDLVGRTPPRPTHQQLSGELALDAL